MGSELTDELAKDLIDMVKWIKENEVLKKDLEGNKQFCTFRNKNWSGVVEGDSKEVREVNYNEEINMDKVEEWEILKDKWNLLEKQRNECEKIISHYK